MVLDLEHMKIPTCAALAALTLPGSAAVLTWNSATPGGIWDTTTLSWLNGASPAAWNNSTPDSAIFGTTGAGTVTLGAPTTTGGITVNAAGYTIAGSNLTLAGATPTITTANDLAISSIVDGSASLTKAGAGTLELTGANTYSGATTVTGGTLKLTTPQTGTGAITLNAGTLALNGGADTAAYGLTKATSITANAGTTIDMLVAIPWGWYGNNNATGLTVNLNGGTFKLNNKRQGSFGVTTNLTGGTIDGGGTTSRWDVGRSAGFNVSINSFASPVKSLISAGTLQLRPDSGQTLFPFVVAQGTTPDGIDLEISSNIAGGATGTMSKQGAGTMKLTGGSSTFAGPFEVTQGKLVLGAGAAFISTPITVTNGVLDVSERADFTLASGKTLVAGKTGAPQTNIIGNFVAAAGSIVNPAGLTAVGTLSINGNLSLGGGTVNIEQSGGTADLIKPTGTLALTGTTTFAASNGYFPAGTYTLLSGQTATTGTASNLAWASGTRGQNPVFTVNPTNVQLTLGTGTPGTLTWSGTTNGVWDVNTTANWNAGAEKFFQLDGVTFADSPTTATVSVTGTVSPSAIAFTNATSPYVVRGTGTITGTAALTKSAAGSVTLWNNANTFSGGTTISGGSIVLNNGAALANGTYSPLGSGAITINAGATLQLNPGNGGGGVYTFPNAIELAGGTLYEDDGDNTLSGDLNVTAPSVIRGHYGGKDLFLAGKLAGSGNLTISDADGYPLYGAGALYLNGDNGTYNGTITIDTGHLVAQANNAIPNAKIVVETAAAVDGWNNNVGFSLGGAATNVTIAGLAGGNADSRVQNTDGTARTLTVNNATDNLFAGAVGSGTFGDTNQNKLAVTKAGAGTLTLAGTNSYTGATTVNGGKLVIQSSNASQDYTVANGATLGVNLVPVSPSLVISNVVLGSGGATSVSLSNFSGNTESPAIDTLQCDTDGTVTINIAGTFTNGTFPLITSAGGFGGDGINAFVLGTLPRGIAAQLDKSDSTTLKLVVTGTNSLVWKGNVSTAWDINTTSNWTLGAAVEKFQNGDVVLFSNAAGANTNVALNASVTPISVTVDSTNNYTISGTGSIGGASGLTKKGTGTLNLGTANTFAGDVQVLQGQLKLGSATALGTTAGSTTVADGGSLDLNGQAIGAEALSITGTNALVNSSATEASYAGPVTLADASSVGGTGDLALSSNISGSGELTKTGTGTLTIGAASGTFTGAVVVQGGTLKLMADRSLPNSYMTTIESGATVAVGINNATRNGNQNTIIKSGGTLTMLDGFTANFGGNQGGTSFLTMEGGSTLGGAAPDEYWGSWVINTVDRKITVAGGAAQAAVISAKAVTPDGANPLRLAVSDVTSSAAADLVVSGSFGSGDKVAFDVEIDGGGTVELAAPNTYTGATKLLSGKLVITDAAALTAASTLNLAAGTSVVLDYTGTLTVTSLVIGDTTMPAGTYGVGGTANAAISGTGTLVVTGTANPYASWATAHGIEGAAADADSDGDGIANGIEFILGADPSGPNSGSHSLLPTLTVNPTTMTFVFRCREDALEMADVQFDTDMADTWTTAVDATDGVTIAVVGGVYPNDPIDDEPVSQVTVTIPRSSAKLFARLIGTFPAAE